MPSTRFTSGITTPTQELEPSPVAVFFKTHSKKAIWAAIAIAAASGLITLATPGGFISFLVVPPLMMLYALTKPFEDRRYEVSRQSIADALVLPSFVPAGLMALAWAMLYTSVGPILATAIVAPIPLLFLPFFARQIRNHKKATWNNMVRRLEIAVIEHVPFAEVDLRAAGGLGTMSVYEEAEWETKRRRQAAFDAWLAVDLPLARKIELMAGGITPDHAKDPDVVKMSAEDLLTLKAMEDLAAPADAV